MKQTEDTRLSRSMCTVLPIVLPMVLPVSYHTTTRLLKDLLKSPYWRICVSPLYGSFSCTRDFCNRIAQMLLTPEILQEMIKIDKRKCTSLPWKNCSLLLLITWWLVSTLLMSSPLFSCRTSSWQTLRIVHNPARVSGVLTPSLFPTPLHVCAWYSWNWTVTIVIEKI